MIGGKAEPSLGYASPILNLFESNHRKNHKTTKETNTKSMIQLRRQQRRIIQYLMRCHQECADSMKRESARKRYTEMVFFEVLLRLAISAVAVVLPVILIIRSSRNSVTEIPWMVTWTLFSNSKQFWTCKGISEVTENSLTMSNLPLEIRTAEGYSELVRAAGHRLFLEMQTHSFDHRSA